MKREIDGILCHMHQQQKLGLAIARQRSNARLPPQSAHRAAATEAL
jgi:hypothetical protein